jgi:hypothetical protein
MNNAEWTSLAGVAFAALLASLGYIYQVRVEHKKSLKRVLYFLLEIRFSALGAVFDSDEAADKYAEHFFARCRAEGLRLDGMALPEGIRQLIASHFERGIALAKSELNDRLLDQFEGALLDLAAVHPTLSHRLLGRNRLEKLAGLTKSYGAKLVEQGVGELQEQWAKDFVKGMSAKVQRTAFDEIVSTLDRDVLELARHCGYFEFRRCKRSLQKAGLRINREFFSEIDPMIDEFLRRLREAAALRAQAPPSAPT